VDADRRRRLAWVAALAGLALLLAAAAAPRFSSVVDDAYISARYAEQFARGNGLVYNAGQPPVEGYTNLAWTVLLGLGRVAGLPMQPMLVWTGLAFGALAVWGTVALGAGLAEKPDSRVLLGGLLLAASPQFAVVTTNGIESSMYTAGVSWAAVAILFGPDSLGAIAAATLGAIRPEGSAIALLLAAGAAYGGKRWPIAGWLVGTSLLLAWRHTTYGAWVPNTWDAKYSRSLLEQLRFNWHYFEPEGPIWAVLALALAATTAWLGRDVRRWTVWTCAVATVAVALRIDLWMPGGRLLQPACAILYACLSAMWVERGGRSGWIGALWAAGLWLTPWGRHPAEYDAHNTVLPNNGTQFAARRLAASLPPGSWLATRDAGMLAYYVGTDVNVLELHDRALTRRHPGGADSHWQGAMPAAPEVVAPTVQRDDAPVSPYGTDRGVLLSLRRRYRYLGRVRQHYHRAYDIYVRDDIEIENFPPGIVLNRDGPEPVPGPRPFPTLPVPPRALDP
jgi:hypothetical protein